MQGGDGDSSNKGEASPSAANHAGSNSRKELQRTRGVVVAVRDSFGFLRCAADLSKVDCLSSRTFALFKLFLCTNARGKALLPLQFPLLLLWCVVATCRHVKASCM
jgi:hypothetical protein